MEKYIDTTVPYYEYDVNRYLSNGWRIKEAGATLVIMEKEDKTYSIIAAQFIKAIKTIAQNPRGLENLESYLSYHFPAWIEKYANTPGGLVSELEHFSKMEG